MEKSNFFVLKPVLSVLTAVLIFAGCEKQPANSVLASTDGVLKDESSVLSSGNSCSSEEAPPPENEYEPKMRECRDPSYYNDLYSADSLPDVTVFCAIFEEKLGQIDEYMPLTEEESSDLSALLRVSEWVDLPEDYELRGEFSGSTTIFVSENAGTLYIGDDYGGNLAMLKWGVGNTKIWLAPDGTAAAAEALCTTAEKRVAQLDVLEPRSRSAVALVWQIIDCMAVQGADGVEINLDLVPQFIVKSAEYNISEARAHFVSPRYIRMFGSLSADGYSVYPHEDVDRLAHEIFGKEDYWQDFIASGSAEYSAEYDDCLALPQSVPQSGFSCGEMQVTENSPRAIRLKFELFSPSGKNLGGYEMSFAPLYDGNQEFLRFEKFTKNS